MNKENIKQSLEQANNLIGFILLIFWFIIPVFQEIRITEYFFLDFQIISLIITGYYGIWLFLIHIINSTDWNRFKEKDYRNAYLPIIIFSVYMLWTLIACVFSPDHQKAFFGDPYRKEGFATYIAYAGIFWIAFIIDSKKYKKALLNIFLVTVFLNIVFLEMVNNGIFENIFANNQLNIGVFYNSNHYGYYLLLATVICNFLFMVENIKKLKIVYGLFYTFLLYYLIFNDTFGCYLALFGTLVLFLIYSIFKKEKIVLAIFSIIIFICVSCCVFKDGINIAYNNLKTFKFDSTKIIDKNTKEEDVLRAGSSRMKLWKYGIKFFFEKPILGYGPENLEVKYNEFGIDQDRPHNLLIQLATTSGLPGLVLYLTAVGMILIHSLKTMKFNENELQIVLCFTVIAYLASAMFGNSMYYTSPYYFIFLGMLMENNVKKEQKNSE